MIIVLFPILLYGIMGPLEIFVGNPYELEFILKDFFYVFLLISAILWLAGSAVLLILPEKAAGFFKTVIFTGSILSYLQNMFFNKKLINADGTPMDWGVANMQTTIISNLVIWIVVAAVCFAIPFVLKERYQKVIFYASAFLCAVQAVAVVSLLVQAGSAAYGRSPLALDIDDQFKVAEKK